MRKRMIMFSMISAMVLLLCACSQSDKQVRLSAGAYYCPYMVDNDNKIIETIIFNEDGTGQIKLQSRDYDFTWKQDGNQVYTSSTIINSTVFECKDKYLISTFNTWEGTIPDKDVFDATLSLKNTFDLEIAFHKSGTVEYTADGNTISGVYSRDGDLITITYDNKSVPRIMLTLDGKLYLNFLLPIE